MKIAVIALSCLLIISVAAALYFGVTSASATSRAESLDERLFNAQQAAREELNLTTTDLRSELANKTRDLDQAKSQLQVAADNIQKLTKRVEELSSHQAALKELPVKLSASRSTTGGPQLELGNLCDQSLALKGLLLSSDLSRSNTFEVTLDPARITPSAKFLPLNNWTPASGDMLELQAPGYNPIRKRLQ